ncbi:MAG: discoidin domain-containing protein [Firmicutes bacterium]|nr:discoidin domain-containing protein [Bacillota bacterium]
MGRYSQQPLVELRFSDPSVEIRFTLDGTEPTRNSQLYTVPFLVGELEQIVRVRAAAFGIDGSGTAASEIRIGLSRSNNVARFRPVRASSQTGGQPARGAVDGRGGRADGFVVPGTGGEAAGADARWAAADLNTGNPAMAQWGNRNQWIMVDLESEIPIDEIIITWQSQAGRLVEGQIAFSNDPSVWTAPSPWVEGLFGREGPRVLDSRWTQLVPLSTVSPTVRYPNPTINTNVAINANPPMFNPSLPGITVDYRQVDLGGRRPRHTVDLSSENITARFVVIDIRRSFDFAPSIWEIEIYAAMADPFVIEGIAQPLAGDAAGAITGITTPDPNITLSNIQLIGATGAGNTFAEGDVPQITFTANVNPATGGFNEEIWSGGNAAGLISAVGSTAITFTRVSNTEITVTISLMTIAPRQSITAPAAATVNGLTLTAVFQDSLGIARNEFAEGETVTVVLHAAGTPADNTRAAIYELNLTSSQVTIASGRPELNMLAASNWVTTPAAIAVTLAPVEPTTQTFNLRPGASPGAGNPLYPAGGFIYTFIMPDAAVTDLQLHFDVRFNLLGYFERHTAGTPSPDFDRARASSVAGATYNPLRNAVNAFNGLYNGDNRWESANNDVSTRSNHPGWIIVDLGAVYDVSDVVITWQSQNASSPTFQILLTDDPDLWNDPRATGANANVVGAISQEQVDNWLSWRADPRWNVAWAANIGPRNTADLTSFASLSRGTTTIIPWRAGTDGAVTFAPRGEVTINGGGTGRYLMFWGDLNGNSGGSFGYSIWEIEVYGTRVSP